MKVKDILKGKGRDTVTIGPDQSVPDAMKSLIEHKISCLPVLDDKEELVGIISDKDIFIRVYTDPAGFQKAKVSDLMTTDVLVGLPDDEMAYIASVMTDKRIRHVPIIEGRKVVGLVSVGDIVKTSREKMEIEVRHLRQFIEGTYPG